MVWMNVCFCTTDLFTPMIPHVICLQTVVTKLKKHWIHEEEIIALSLSFPRLFMCHKKSAISASIVDCPWQNDCVEIRICHWWWRAKCVYAMLITLKCICVILLRIHYSMFTTFQILISIKRSLNDTIFISTITQSQHQNHQSTPGICKQINSKHEWYMIGMTRSFCQ